MALSDEDILARYREKRSPYITLATAKELHRVGEAFRRNPIRFIVDGGDAPAVPVADRIGGGRVHVGGVPDVDGGVVAARAGPRRPALRVWPGGAFARPRAAPRSTAPPAPSRMATSTGRLAQRCELRKPCGGRGRYRTADRWCVKPELYH
ncbi:MAG: hypothetical protein QOI74_3160 [Micromonosporaceae bacterium]|nr:hypothetical protein [Micromonosporaceae bacterium]